MESGATSTCEHDIGEDFDVGDGPPSKLRLRAERALQRYAELHRAILDPADRRVEKKFLVLQPLLGMGNSQIEEVTALLIAMETNRALVIDLFDRSVGDQVPEVDRKPWFAPYTDTYDRAIDLSKEQLATFVKNNAQVALVPHLHTPSCTHASWGAVAVYLEGRGGGGGWWRWVVAVGGSFGVHDSGRGRFEQVAMLPERREHLYAQFNEFVACGDWTQDLKESIVVTSIQSHCPAHRHRSSRDTSWMPWGHEQTCI